MWEIRDMSEWWKRGSAKGLIAVATSTTDAAPNGAFRLNPNFGNLAGPGDLFA